MNQQLVTELADEKGDIKATNSGAQGPEIQVDINIRQDDLRMFHTSKGQMLLRTSEMESCVYIEPKPTAEGFKPEIVVNPQSELTEVEPAKPAEQPDVDQTSFIETRMD